MLINRIMVIELIRYMWISNLHILLQKASNCAFKMKPSTHLSFLLQSLAEKGGPVMDNITAHENFFVLATMNPGGDYGKKELSPALRNRFTEIWVPPVCDLDELGDIASKRYVQL